MTDIRLLDDKYDNTWTRLFIEICGLDFEKYYYQNDILTLEILEPHLDEIIEEIHNISKMSSKDSILVGYQILGVLILQSGTRMPDVVRNSIMSSTKWEYDKSRGWAKPCEKERKENLERFRNAIILHKIGVKTNINF